MICALIGSEGAAMRWLVMALGLASPVGAGSLNYSFEWQGGGGYTLRGAMSLPAEMAGVSRVYETDVSCFEITGYRDGEKLGRWALGMLLPDTTWTLTFDPSVPEFLVFSPQTPMPQAWNMDGAGFNCGDPGFGFNIGSAAQDLCIDGQLIVQSQVPPPQPFPAELAPGVTFSQDACRPTLLLGRAE